ncbi:VIT1/CCC1 transporter family protein [uncultured Porticoccus sp.]|uniref:VIT1/CCC1 transporter family protein n=1 Tax=uncultured Porticoccus sp. TaxID=1256050 RepID=UPI0030D789E4
MQSDTEKADLALEKTSLEQNPGLELDELAKIYESRGVRPSLAKQVAEELTAHDALGAHARDEIGISPSAAARPIQAALYSAATFTIGAALPLFVAWLQPGHRQIVLIASLSLVFLAFLGGIAARTGGAPVGLGAARVTFWGAIAMALTAAVGQWFGVAV